MNHNHTINAYFIGVGRIAQKHWQVVEQLSDEDITVIGVCDLDIEKCHKLVGNKDVAIDADYKTSEAFNASNLVVVLTESGSHFEHARCAIESGKDVLIEKPVTLTLKDAYELEKLAKEHGRNIFVVKQNRFNPPVAKAQNLYETGRLGILNIGTIRVRWSRSQDYYDQAAWRGTWRYDGGVIANQASHHIDLLQWFMGPVESVYSYSARFGVDIETEDTIVAVVKFKSGALGTIEATTCIRPRNLEGSLSLIGSKGSLEVGGFAVNELKYVQLDDINESAINKLSVDTSDVYGAGHKNVYAEIIKHRMGLANETVDISESIKSLELIHLIYKSVEEQRMVSADELNSGSALLGV